MDVQDKEEYQRLTDQAFRNTVAVGIGKPEWEGQTVHSHELAKQCQASGIVVAGGGIYGVLTAGHVVAALEGQKGEGLVLIGRPRTLGDGRRPVVVKHRGMAKQIGVNLLLKEHREVRTDDVGFIWLTSGDVETIRSVLGCTGYNLTKEREPEPETAKALCAAANNRALQEANERGTPEECVFGVNNYQAGMVGGRLGGETWYEKRLSLVELSEHQPTMEGTSGAGVWVQEGETGEKAKLIGVVCSHLNGWPKEGMHHLLIHTVKDVVEWLRGERREDPGNGEGDEGIEGSREHRQEAIGGIVGPWVTDTLPPPVRPAPVPNPGKET